MLLRGIPAPTVARVQGAELQSVPGVGHRLLLETFEGTLAPVNRVLDCVGR